MNLIDLIEQCAETTKAKGFDVTQHGTQLALIATEIGEALENVTPTHNVTTDLFIDDIKYLSSDYEGYRSMSVEQHNDASFIMNDTGFMEELADIQIRLCSYIGGNGWAEEFLAALQAKMEKNLQRPMKHGKAF